MSTTEPRIYIPQHVTTTTPPAQSTMTTTPRPAVIHVAKSSSSSSSSRQAWVRCADWLLQSGRWISRRRYEVAPIGATSTLTTLGLGQQGILPAISYGVLSLGAGAAAAFGLKFKNEMVIKIGAGGFVALADVTVAAGWGWSWTTLTSWALTTGAAYGVYVPWLTEQRNARIKLNVDTIKARGALPGAMGLDAADSGLTGSTPQETALRRALHALVGATPQCVDAMTIDEHGGFTALVTMPPGKNTSPDAIIRKQAQLAANLGLTGTLQVTKGDNSQLVIRLIVADVLAGTIAYSDDDCTSVKDGVRLGRDDLGQPVDIQILYRHTLVAGASDWGKSGIVNLIIKRLARRADVDVYGIDLKPGAPELGPWEPLMKRLAKTPEEARDLLDWLEGESQRRGAELSALSARELSAGRDPVRKWVPGVHGNAIVVITDELAELVRQDEQLQKEEAEQRKHAMRGRARDEVIDLEEFMPRMPVAQQYESRLAVDRFLAMSYVSATQQPSRRVFGGNTDARGNYANRISTRTGEAGHATFIFGQGCQARGYRPEQLDLPGKFLIQTPELTEATECRAEYVTDADIAADVSHLHARGYSSRTPQPTAPRTPAPEPSYFPDGTVVGRDQWPDLWELFAARGSATKKELAEAAGVSRDTAMRAIEEWARHGVTETRDGRATRYCLPPAPPAE